MVLGAKRLRTGTLTTTAPYTAAYPDPLKVRAGDCLTIGQRDPDYPGWVWCTSKSAKSGWVPENYLAIEGDQGLMRHDYDATELTVAAGEMVELLGSESGWGLCRTAEGHIGWLPLSILSE